ncbi:Cysteine dioxygenase [Bulinus truncatus]|nr:Cysteine dioxygenase [Bulinus truncatus]
MNMSTSKDLKGYPAIHRMDVLKEQLEGLDWLDKHNISESVSRTLRRYEGAESDWGKYRIQSMTGYARCLIHTCLYFELFLLSFQPMKANLPHDHGEAECRFKVLKGKLIEKKFVRRVLAGPLCWKCIQQYETNSTNETPDIDFCHCCSNPSNTEEAVSLVIYYPPIKRCNYYDVDTGGSSVADLDFDSPVHGMDRVSPSSRGLDSVVVEDYYDIYR